MKEDLFRGWLRPPRKNGESMKKFKMKKFMMTIISAFVLRVMSSIMVFAADVETTAGATVTVDFEYTDAAGLKGTINLSNDTFFDGALQSITATGGTVDYNPANGMFVFSMANKGSGTISIQYKVSGSASEGDSCIVTLTDLVKPADDNSSDVAVDAMSVNVYIPTSSSDDGGNDPTPTPNAPESTPIPTETPGSSDDGGNDDIGSDDAPVATQAPSTPATTPAPTKAPVVTSKIDYSELLKQIGIAEKLKANEYTKDSWAVLKTALADAKAAKASTSQDVVDKAAKALADAIASLVKVDYSRLQAAINDANALVNSDEMAKLWKMLFTSVSNGEMLLASNDQKAIDAAADEILELIEKLKAALVGEPVQEEEIKEVVNVIEPEGDYCNLSLHKIWPILFFVSLLGNVLLVVYIITSKKKSQKDTTPLVDYEISDDDQ